MNKNNSPINLLTKKQCAERYKVGLEKSEKLWAYAEFLASKKDFDLAVRDHIFSIEELVKALIIFLDSYGFEFRKVEGMNKILSQNHSLRHFIAFLMMGMNILGDMFKTAIKTFLHDVDILDKVSENKGKYEMAIKVMLYKSILKMRNEFVWFRKIEALRQDGSHIDYRSDSLSPSAINEYEYNQALTRLETVRNLGYELIKSFSSEYKHFIFSKQFVKLQNDFAGKGWYDKIGKALQKINGRKTPFDLVLKNIYDEEYDETFAEFKDELRKWEMITDEQMQKFTKGAILRKKIFTDDKQQLPQPLKK